MPTFIYPRPVPPSVAFPVAFTDIYGRRRTLLTYVDLWHAYRYADAALPWSAVRPRPPAAPVWHYELWGEYLARPRIPTFVQADGQMLYGCDLQRVFALPRRARAVFVPALPVFRRDPVAHTGRSWSRWTSSDRDPRRLRTMREAAWREDGAPPVRTKSLPPWDCDHEFRREAPNRSWKHYRARQWKPRPVA